MALFVYRIDLLWHAWMVHASLAEFEAESSLDLASFGLEISARNRYYRFHPRFIVNQADRVGYTPRPSPDMTGFAGWLPYVNKRWAIGCGKFAFKDFCAEQRLPTPRMWRAPQPGMRDFLVKHDLSSSGDGMRGPFTEFDAANPAQALPEGGYYEQFVRGGMLKAWYWEDRLVGLEVHPMPSVTGNGRSTMRELIGQNQRRMQMRLNWAAFDDIARYQGLGLDGVPEQGRALLADFRYNSALAAGMFDNTPSMVRHQNSAFVPELRRIGRVLWLGIPEEVRPATLFSVDAIVDADDKLWLLEMNCNPAVHPETYPHMMETLFGPRGTVTGARRGAAAPAPSPAPTSVSLQSLGLPQAAPPSLVAHWAS